NLRPLCHLEYLNQRGGNRGHADALFLPRRPRRVDGQDATDRRAARPATCPCELDEVLDEPTPPSRDRIENPCIQPPHPRAERIEGLDVALEKLSAEVETQVSCRARSEQHQQFVGRAVFRVP